MDGKEERGFGAAVKGDEAPQSFSVATRAENPSQPGAPTMAAPSSHLKKKRGRPRKYGPDGRITPPLCPMPISASIPLAGESPVWKQPKMRSFQTTKKAQKVEFQSLAAQFPCVSGGNFTAHVIIVSAGEDIAMRIISFSQRESRGICVLSACGLVSNVTLRQHNSFGGTLTYEGRYEILSLTGSFMPTDNGIANSRIGGLSVSLAGPDGSVLGGGLAGLLVAASPVQVVLGSFTPKPRRQRAEPIAPATPGFVSPVSEGGYGAQNVDFASPSSSFLSMPSFNSDEDSRELETDNEVSTLSEDSYVNDADNLENSGEP